MHADAPDREGPPPQRTSPSEPEAWLDLHGDALFRYALLRTRDRDLAEELVQETLVAALGAHEQFSGRSAERTWMIGILRRKMVDHIRQASRSREQSVDGPSEAVPEGNFDARGHWVSLPAAWPGDPASAFENREFWAVYDACMSKLPRPLSDVFVLREIEALETEEVCKILSITASNLWTRLHRARTALRQCLERNWYRRGK